MYTLIEIIFTKVFQEQMKYCPLFLANIMMVHFHEYHGKDWSFYIKDHYSIKKKMFMNILKFDQSSIFSDFFECMHLY